MPPTDRPAPDETSTEPTSGGPAAPTPVADVERAASLRPTTVTPYLCVHDSRAAIEWYGRVFGAVLSHDPIVEEGGRVGHAEVTIDSSVLMLSDEYPELGVLGPRSLGGSGIALSVYVPDADATYAAAVAAGATGVREPSDQFYGERSGVLIDPFGHRWFVNTPLQEPRA